MEQEINKGGIDRALRAHLNREPSMNDFHLSEEKITRTQFKYYYKNQLIHVENRRISS